MIRQRLLPSWIPTPTNQERTASHDTPTTDYEDISEENLSDGAGRGTVQRCFEANVHSGKGIQTAGGPTKSGSYLHLNTYTA